MNLRLIIPAAAGLLAACTALTPGYANLALANLFDTERAFARMASANATTYAFNQYLAPDAVVFRPGPVTYPRVPASPGPRDASVPVLEWAPQAGAVALADDIGYTTGPYRVMKRGERLPLDRGYFFSIWKRVDGQWRVAIDAGVATVAPTPQEGLPNLLLRVTADPPSRATAQQLATARDELLARERTPRSLLQLPPEGTPSYYDWITPSTRWLRSGPPARFGADIRNELVERGGRIEWTPADVTVAQSNDLAYSYGSYVRTLVDGQVLPGWYVHVWQRNDLREWKLAVAVWLPPQ